MGLNIGALGNFAGGVAKGISAYQEQAARDREIAMREEALGMQKKEFGWRQKEQDQKAEFNNLLQQAFGQDAPVLVPFCEVRGVLADGGCRVPAQPHPYPRFGARIRPAFNADPAHRHRGAALVGFP